jgi:archaellum component FlaD/FlaE
VVEQLANDLKGYCDQVTDAASDVTAKVEKRREEALQKNERQEKKNEKAAEAAKQKQEKAVKADKKRKDREEAAAAEGGTLKKPKKKAVVPCGNPCCGAVRAEGEQGWLKCQHSKKCKMHFCPSEVCQTMRNDHEAVCRA